jgi:hypothetical protein
MIKAETIVALLIFWIFSRRIKLSRCLPVREGKKVSQRDGVASKTSQDQVERDMLNAAPHNTESTDQ